MSSIWHNPFLDLNLCCCVFVCVGMYFSKCWVCYFGHFTSNLKFSLFWLYFISIWGIRGKSTEVINLIKHSYKAFNYNIIDWILKLHYFICDMAKNGPWNKNATNVMRITIYRYVLMKYKSFLNNILTFILGFIYEER